jgi:general L-amino acid transport system substrate-binding protein
MRRPVRTHHGFVVLLLFALFAAACEPGPTPSPTGTGEASPGPSVEATAEATSSPAATASPVSTEGRLADVQSRGQLICGVNGGLPGFSFLEEGTGEWSGFDADFCRAVAAAVLGDAEAVEFRPLSADERSTALQTGEVDVLIRNTTWTVSRDTAWGLFAPTTFYDGQGMMVTSATNASTLEDLEGATICVQSGTTTELNLTDQMRALGVEFSPQVFGDIDATYDAYSQGRCDAVTSDRSQLVARRTQFTNPDDHVILDVVMSKEPLGPVAPLGDDQWFNVVKWVVFATFEAEEQGIDAANVEQTRDSSENPVIRRLLGVQPDAGELAAGLGLEDDWVVNVITAVGNYGEIYDRNLGPGTPFDLDRGPNRQWTDGGLLYAAPYR